MPMFRRFEYSQRKMDVLHHFYYNFRPYLFDVAGLMLILGIILFLVYIRCGLPWVAKASGLLVLIGAVPIGLLMCTGYFGS